MIAAGNHIRQAGGLAYAAALRDEQWGDRQGTLAGSRDEYPHDEIDALGGLPDFEAAAKAALTNSPRAVLGSRAIRGPLPPASDKTAIPRKTPRERAFDEMALIEARKNLRSNRR